MDHQRDGAASRRAIGSGSNAVWARKVPNPLRCHFFQDAIDRHPGDAELASNGCRPLSFIDHEPDLLTVNARLGACVDALTLGSRNALCLTLAPHVGLELGEHRQHAEEGTAGRSRCVDALLDNPQVSAYGVDLVCEVRQIPQRTAKSIEAGDDQRVALRQHLQCEIELITTVALAAGTLLLEHDRAAVLVKGGFLDREVLVIGADPGVADAACHGLVSLLSQFYMAVTLSVT